MKLSHIKDYEFTTKNGSTVKVKIEAETKNLCKGDLEEILHEYAACTHNFYLSLGRKITGDDQ